MSVAAAPELVATYRLQLHAGFTLTDATAVVPYLAELGVSHLYLSPILQATPGSTHGYDQCDPTRVSAELGGESAFRELATVARAHGLGIVLDIVPNHMAADQANPWWWELLRAGREGRSGVYFDVDWDSPGLDGRVMVPVLGAPLPEVLARGENSVVDLDGAPALAYFDQRLPLGGSPAVAPGDPVTPGLLERQAYRLAYWRDGALGLNYRRFFDINSLVAVREEDPAVFVTLHALPLQLAQQGDVQGLRIDHVDGLRDPAGYLAALRGLAPAVWLLVEKILEPGERLPADWPVDGTTGYDFIHRLQGVFVDGEAEAALTRLYTEFTGDPGDYQQTVLAAKLEAARRLFVPDVRWLARLLGDVCRESGLEASPVDLVRAIEEVGARLPVYRTYGRAGHAPGDIECRHVEAAIAGARESGPAIAEPLLGLLQDTLLMKSVSPAGQEFALRFQQFSGPLMAKGVEDTAFYRFNRLVCLNEVGGDPGTLGVSIGEFHAANAETLARYPQAMLASSTHDTKRSEDVRARLALLSQVPDEWSAAVNRWSAMNTPHRTGDLPDRNTEYLFYQALVGAWPLPEDRALAYIRKATREAKVYTSWTDPDERYEAALEKFVRGLLGDPAFQADLAGFAGPLVEPGRTLSLAQALVKLTAPGVPDIYQGTEAWDLSLVDPDNRRPVDYELRRELMRRQPGAPFDPREQDDVREAGLPKLHLVTQALTVRRSSPAAFDRHSTYTPITASGPAAGNLLVYARGTAEDPLMVLVVVPRFVLGKRPPWTDTTIEVGAGEWQHVLAGGSALAGPSVEVEALFARHPVALLERAS